MSPTLQSTTAPESPRRGTLISRRPSGSPLCIVLALAVFLAQFPARADSTYEVTLNTTSLEGSAATLAFDFVAGGGSETNDLTISDFHTDGTLGTAGPNSGSATGGLAGAVTLSTLGGSSFFNELLQGITLGSTLSFHIDATTNAPTSGALSDTFSLFLLDSTAANSLITTGDPTGADSLLTLQIDGTSGGNLSAYSGLTPAVPVSVGPVSASAAPEMHAATAFTALTLMVGALAVIRGRRCCATPPYRCATPRGEPSCE